VAARGESSPQLFTLHCYNANVDASVIEAIKAALLANPDSMALRSHLMVLLTQAQRFNEALEQASWVLERQPDHVETLLHAAIAGEAVGDARAAGWRRLHSALVGSSNDSDFPGSSSSGGLVDTSAISAFDTGPTSMPRFAADGRPIQRISEDGRRLDDPAPERVGVTNQGDESDDSSFMLENVDIKLANVAGMQEVKRRLNLAFLAPLQNPDLMRMYGKKLRGGLLLYGPPGCGKTFIARATAGELNARFLAIGLSDVLDMWLGNSEKNLHQIFETARRKAPCVLFIDEIDALGRKRSQMRNSSANVINQLLAEMDGVNANNDGVFVLAATNSPWDVDSALRRPGRLDRTLLVLPPDLEARVQLLNDALKTRPTQTIDLRSLAKRTDGMSGADVTHLVDSAAEIAIEESLQTGKARAIEQSDFERALRDVKPSTKDWFENAKNYAMFANDGGHYDDLLEYLKRNRML
jgi:AAA+ superfamily predicted ATPase